MTTSPTQHFWLFKTEPGCFSYDDLLSAPKRITHWSGVRNYQARNFMRDDMKKGDGVLFYYSSANPAGIVGTAEIVKEGYPDWTALVEGDEHFDSKSTEASPIWYMVDIRARKRFENFLPLNDLRHVRALERMELLRRGSRLSIQPVTAKEWQTICAMGHNS